MSEQWAWFELSWIRTLFPALAEKHRHSRRRHHSRNSMHRLFSHGSGSRGQDELVEALEKGDLGQVRAHLARRVNPNFRFEDPWGKGSSSKVQYTPLLWAAERGNLPLMQLLLRAGASPHAQLQGRDVPYTALHIAAHKGNDAMATLLLEHGAQVNFAVEADCSTPSMFGTVIPHAFGTPVHVACLRGHASTIILLLSRPNVDVNAQLPNSLGRPIHLAIASRDVASVEAVLRFRPNLETVCAGSPFSNGPRTALQYAVNMVSPCWSNRAAVVALLARHGADLDARDGSGNTVLHWAVDYDWPNVVRALIELGADVFAENAAGKTCVDLAQGKGKKTQAAVMEYTGRYSAASTPPAPSPAPVSRGPSLPPRTVSEPRRQSSASARTPPSHPVGLHPWVEEPSAPGLYPTMESAGAALGTGPGIVAGAGSVSGSGPGSLGLCAVCMDAPVSQGCLHHGTLHACLCTDCAVILRNQGSLTHCPICSVPCESIISVFTC